MTSRPLDTSELAWSRMEQAIAQMTPMQRVQRSISLTILSHSFALAKIRKQHPDESDRIHRLRLAARFIDADTLQAATGWSDGEKPRTG